MDELTIQKIIDETAPLLAGRSVNKIFQLGRTDFAIGFHVPDSPYLFISLSPREPCIYLIQRAARDLEKQSEAPSQFLLGLRKLLSGSRLLSLTKDDNDRIVRFSFLVNDELGGSRNIWLVAQLTGRSANLFLLEHDQRIIEALRQSLADGRRVGEQYFPPVAQLKRSLVAPRFELGPFASLSEAADDFYRRGKEAQANEDRIRATRDGILKAIEQRKKLKGHLLADLESHGNAVEHKRIGDLLLANISTSDRRGNSVTVTDYYSEGLPRIEISLDENTSLQEEAAHRFAQFGKAKRAQEEISQRLELLEQEITALIRRIEEIDHLVATGEQNAIEIVPGAVPKQLSGSARGKDQESLPGIRKFRSSDGFDVLVGRGARDNDHLTFHIARPHDLWLHAADYPGSHVIVRNGTRAEIPHRSIIEAAQLAAYFSKAKKDSKVDVHYTSRKFLQKPKGSAPGLVRMSSFRSITVEPRQSISRIEKQ